MREGIAPAHTEDPCALESYERQDNELENFLPENNNDNKKFMKLNFKNTVKGKEMAQTLNERIRGAGKRCSVNSSARVLHAASAAALSPSWAASSAP